MVALIVIGLPVIAIFYGFHRFFRFREKQLDADVKLAAEKAAQYATSNAELEARVRVLEKIVTDGGLETAAQIEALRTPRLEKGDKVQ
jgi:ABC-type phosphate transport system auxiliary subunit